MVILFLSNGSVIERVTALLRPNVRSITTALYVKENKGCYFIIILTFNNNI